MESQPKNPGFRNNPKNFHPCTSPGHAALRRFTSTKCIFSLVTDSCLT